MWAKIYTVDASFHHFSDVSKVAYLEILDKDNDAVLQTRLNSKKEWETDHYSCLHH